MNNMVIPQEWIERVGLVNEATEAMPLGDSAIIDFYYTFMSKTDIKVQQHIRERDLLEAGDDIKFSMTATEYIAMQRIRQVVVETLRVLNNNS